MRPRIRAHYITQDGVALRGERRLIHIEHSVVSPSASTIPPRETHTAIHGQGVSDPVAATQAHEVYHHKYTQNNPFLALLSCVSERIMAARVWSGGME